MEFQTEMAKEGPICLKNLIPFVSIRVHSRLKIQKVAALRQPAQAKFVNTTCTSSSSSNLSSSTSTSSICSSVSSTG